MSTTQFSRRRALQFVAGAASGFLLPKNEALSFISSAQAAAEPQAVRSFVENAEDAAALVLRMAGDASQSGTFGVGGAIIENRTGRVIHAMHNRVMQRLRGKRGQPDQYFTKDPTAHGERQLVFWYFANRDKLKLPPPRELTIVTTLDPCAMCAGTLMTAGFNVAVVAFDDFAGVNWTRDASFESYPAGIRDLLRETFGYYAVTGERRYSGGKSILFAQTEVSQPTAHACETIFTASAERVRKESSNSGLDPADPRNGMVDPAQLKQGSPLRKAIKNMCKHAFALKLANYRSPDHKLRAYLEGLVRTTPKAKNAVAFIDYFGNLIAASADRFDINPAATAFMTVVQEYSLMRFSLANAPDMSALAARYLSSPRYGTFVWLFAPDGLSTNSLKDLGAYGSTMEGPIPVAKPSNFQYFTDPLIGTADDLLNLIKAMPPLYGPALVDIRPEKVVLS